MERNYFTVLFFIKKSKLLKNGEAPICMRITMDGRRAEVQIKRSIPLEKWDQLREGSIGTEVQDIELNHYLATVRTKVLRIYRELEMDGKPISAEILKNYYYGKKEKPKMLLEVFEKHNQQCRDLMDKGFVKGTVLRYERTVKYLAEFIKAEYNLTDMPLKDIRHSFVTNFEHHIKSTKRCDQNTTLNYLKGLKKIVRLALANKWMDIDPFAQIKFRQTPTNREFLLEEELRMLLNKQFDIERLETVRDIFVFCCMTGLAFTDVKHLTHDHIICDDKGEYWIRKPREKTSNMCDVPILAIPMTIIEKYKTHPECERTGRVLPVPSNQRMNGYMKEIADLCGIKKKLTTHLARHRKSFNCVYFSVLQS